MKTLNNIITIKLLTLLFGIHPSISKRFLNTVSKIRKDSGLPFCIKYMKSVRLHITRYMCGKPLYSNDDRVSLTKGFPTRFIYLKELIDSNNVSKRGVLTLLYFIRSIKPTSKEYSKVVPKFNSITDNYKGKNYSIPMYFISDWIKENKLNKEVPKYDGKLHYLSNKSSPFGKSTLTGPFALFYMIEHAQNTLTYFLNMLGEVSYKNLIGDFIKLLWNDHRLMYPGKVKGSTGSISIVKDPELKLRPIAMLDYYSQFVLRPIHDDLLNNLSKLSQDRTFSQDPFNNWITKGNQFWSLDLSSATDRFPISLQEKLISVMYNNREFALNWKKLLIDRSFEYKGTYLKYSVGQPMGAYSSWGAFTLCHHLVVAWSAKLAGYDNFKDYILLGDDIVINNDKVANKYIKVMTRLGVDIPNAKTHVSKNTYEFAKRWIHKKIEISPLPLKGIISNINNPHVVLQQLMVYCMRNHTLCKGTMLDLISRLYHNLKVGKRYYTFNSTHKLCYDLYHILRYAYSLSTNNELYSYLITKNKSIINICNEDLVPSFLRAILCQGLYSQAEKASNEIKNYFEDYINLYNNLPNFKIGDLRYEPILHGIYNRSIEIKKSLNNFVNDDNSNIIDCMTSMRIEKIDKLVSMNRETAITVSKLDKLWRKSLSDLNKITEENYFNYEISNFGSYTTAMKQWENKFKDTLSNHIGKYDVLRYGHYTDPKNAFANMWM
jgi:hypothetical protein